MIDAKFFPSNLEKTNLSMEHDEDVYNAAELAQRNWNRVINVAAKAGYREGIEAGKQSVFQEGFDIGYEEAFQTAFTLGRYKGLAVAMAGNYQNQSYIDDILEQTRHGACQVCIAELKKNRRDEEEFVEPPLQQVRDEQRKYSIKILGALQEMFDPPLQELGRQLDNISL